MYLIATLCIKEDPAKLNYFGRVLGNIHAMLITRCGHMDDHITVEIGLLPLIVCHSNIPTWGISPSTLNALKYNFAALLGICKSWRSCCSVRTSQAGRGLCVALAKGGDPNPAGSQYEDNRVFFDSCAILLIYTPSALRRGWHFFK